MKQRRKKNKRKYSNKLSKYTHKRAKMYRMVLAQGMEKSNSGVSTSIGGAIVDIIEVKCVEKKKLAKCVFCILNLNFSIHRNLPSKRIGRYGENATLIFATYDDSTTIRYELRK